MTKNKTIEIQTLHDERRDLFAAAALTGLLANGKRPKLSAEDVARRAVDAADAMIAASKKTDNEKTD